MQNINFKNKKIGILGLGEENVALIRFLVEKEVKITVCDQKTKGELGEYYEQVKYLPVQFRLGPNYLDGLEDFEIVFRTPGLPYFQPKIQQAKRRGVEISSEIKLFFDLCPCPIIGVTGTKGKGTTATLISEILEYKSQIPNPKSQTNSKFKILNKCLNSKIYLGGNIGNPPIEFLKKLNSDDLVVLELSSFQLQDLHRSPHIAVILDIKVDHLDYHQNEKEYVEAKQNIVKFQKKSDFACISADYLTSIEFATLTPAEVFWFSRQKSVDQGCWVRNNQDFILRINDKDTLIIKTSEILLPGQHNWENVSAAIISSYLAGADIAVIRQVLKTFKGLEHRLELVRTLDGASFYNDSFSTTPETTIAAIKSFSQPIILLLGGSEKKADYRELAEVISSSKAKAVISIGQTAKRILKDISNPQIKKISGLQTMTAAVRHAKGLAQKDDIILLSPASASFDCFQNYKERGRIFKKEVLNL